MASDLLMFYTQEFAYISLAAEVTTGSSIMPQKRNPDVLELLRASSATTQACLDEALMITAKLPSGYHRDLQRLKAPVFRSIDLAIDSVDIMAYVLEGLAFLPENITWTRASLRRPRPTDWSPRKACHFARPTGKSPSATQNDVHKRRPTSIIEDDPRCGHKL